MKAAADHLTCRLTHLTDLQFVQAPTQKHGEGNCVQRAAHRRSVQGYAVVWCGVCVCVGHQQLPGEADGYRPFAFPPLRSSHAFPASWFTAVAAAVRTKQPPASVLAHRLWSLLSRTPCTLPPPQTRLSPANPLTSTISSPSSPPPPRRRDLFAVLIPTHHPAPSFSLPFPTRHPHH